MKFKKDAVNIVQKNHKGQQNIMGKLFVAPPIILFLVFICIPIIMALILSFTEYDVINAPEFVGLKNYKKLLTDDFFGLR